MESPGREGVQQLVMSSVGDYVVTEHSRWHLALVPSGATPTSATLDGGVKTFRMKKVHLRGSNGWGAIECSLERSACDDSTADGCRLQHLHRGVSSSVHSLSMG